MTARPGVHGGPASRRDAYCHRDQITCPAKDAASRMIVVASVNLLEDRRERETCASD